MAKCEDAVMCFIKFLLFSVGSSDMWHRCDAGRLPSLYSSSESRGKLWLHNSSITHQQFSMQFLHM